jgi:sulfate transport system ATP-binding protein
MDFVGETARIPVTIKEGQAWYGDQPTGFHVKHQPNGPATLYVRPSDLELVPAGLQATVTSTRRHGQGSRTKVLVGDQDLFLEVDTPISADLKRSQVIHLAARGGRLFTAR